MQHHNDLLIRNLGTSVDSTNNHNIDRQFIIDEHQAGKRFDQVLSELAPEFSRNQHKQWILDQSALLDNQAAKPKDKVKLGQEITLSSQLKPQSTAIAQNLPLDIIYEDDEILVINKPAGFVVHPGAGNQNSTLLNALLHHHKNLELVPRAGIVHRLDKDTTGLMVIAKTIQSHNALIEAMQNREIKREYEAIVEGIMISGGTVKAPIGRHRTKRTQMTVTSHQGKSAVTHYRIAEKFRAHTHLRLQLETGRTHQIRVHMAHIRHAIIGDPVYGQRLKLPKGASDEFIEALKGFKRQALHAIQLTLNHPVSGEELSWRTELPQDMLDLIVQLKYDTSRFI